MNLTVYQSISINLLKVGSVTNSSVLQIGSTGVIQAESNLYNTGGYTGPAAEALPQTPGFTGPKGEVTGPVVPLAPPS